VSPDLSVQWQPIDRNAAAKCIVIDPWKGSGVSDISITWQNCKRAARLLKYGAGKWRSERQSAVEAFLRLKHLHVAEFTLRR